jgi:hypothetical protein
MIAVSACSGSAVDSAYVSRPAPNSYVRLEPELRGGRVGWCLATWTETATEGSGGCGDEVTTTSTGPIFTESCNEGTALDIYALTRSEVVAVSAYGGTPIPTRTNATLPDGLRAVAVTVLRRHGHPSIGQECPRLTPLDAEGEAIRGKGKPGRPQWFKLPGTLEWEEPAHQPKGACQLTAARLPPETITYEGDVTTRIRPYRGLLGRAFLSCVDTVYIYEEQHDLRAAVLLDASHPGTTPPPLAGMKPLTGHPGIFAVPGPAGEMAARRIRGAWLVVEEEDRIGLRVPVELLEWLQATIHV